MWVNVTMKDASFSEKPKTQKVCQNDPYFYLSVHKNKCNYRLHFLGLNPYCIVYYALACDSAATDPLLIFYVYFTKYLNLNEIYISFNVIFVNLYL